MHQYERLDLWVRGIALAARLHRSARSATAWTDRALWMQVTRAATSIPANVAEEAQRGSDREFARFFGIAMGSASELHSLLTLAAKSGALATGESASLIAEAMALRRMANALRARARGDRSRTRTPAKS